MSAERSGRRGPKSEFLRTQAPDILEFVQEYTSMHGHSPSQTEVGMRFNVSREMARRWMDRLEDQGFIRREWKNRRRIKKIEVIHAPTNK